jgi:ATP-dependent protease ClpP protease subunit
MIYILFKNLDVPVTTYTTKAYSIASVIFMAGETRVIPEGAIINDSSTVDGSW